MMTGRLFVIISTVVVLVTAVVLIPCDIGDKIDYGHLGEEVTVGAEEYNAYVTAPNGTSKGGVVVIHDIFGWELTNTRAMVDMFAKNGYHSIVPDSFYGNAPWSRNSGSGYGSFMAKNSPLNTKKIVDISIDYMKDRYNVTKFGVVGFCWGGLAVHHLMAENPRDELLSGVACYGRPLGISNYGHIKRPTFFIFGAADSGIPQNDVNMLKSSLRKNTTEPFKVRSYEGQGHGFAHRKKTGPYDPSKEQIDKARRGMIRWFDRYVK